MLLRLSQLYGYFPRDRKWRTVVRQARWLVAFNRLRGKTHLIRFYGNGEKHGMQVFLLVMLPPVYAQIEMYFLCMYCICACNNIIHHYKGGRKFYKGKSANKKPGMMY